MRLLVLGGTHHVGRSVVEVALAAGHSVTTINRGVSGPPAQGCEARYADRLDQESMRGAIGSGEWDAVIDTWSGSPRAVGVAARLLADRAAHYGYVSSRSVYRWPIPPGADETAAVVDGDPDSTERSDYSLAKRGGEIAALNVFGDRTLVARAGLILGPYERMGRLPWWLRRLERGGPVLAPGPPDRPLQYVDGRDLAAWMLSQAAQGRGGTFNTVSRPGHTSIGELLERANDVVGSSGQLVWATPEEIEGAGVAPWTELPIWLPPDGEDAALHDGDVTAALQAGLTCRPISETVTATWDWLQREGDPPSLAAGSVGLSPDKERRALAGLARRPPP